MSISLTADQVDVQNNQSAERLDQAETCSHESQELFPLKANGGIGGKDLFDGRIKGRGAQRRRAADLFD